MAAADIVEADHKEFVGVDRFTGANVRIPPTGAFVAHAVVASSVMMAREGVANQYSITFVGVELAIGFINELVFVQGFTASQQERLAKVQGLRCDNADGIGR